MEIWKGPPNRVRLLNATHAINDYPQRIAQLVRMAGQSIALAAIERTLAQGVVSEPTLRDLQARLETEAADNLLYHGVRGERAVVHQTYELLREGQLTMSQVLGGAKAKPGQAWTSRMGERLLDTFPNVLLNAYPEFFRLMNEEVQASKLKDVAQTEPLQKVEQKACESRNMLTRVLLPPGYARKIAEASQRSQAWMRCMIAGVAAERFRLKHKNWPRALDDLVKDGLLKDIPKDPYDGQPLRWRRTATGVIVYSVGPDKIDDGGKLNRDSPLTAGTDLGFELWDFPRTRGVPAPANEEKPLDEAR
jgi:hypothetical protein